MHTHSVKMALDYILANDGVGYLPSPVVANAKQASLIHLVEDAPVMEQSLYLVWREDNEKEDLIKALVEVPFKNVIENI